MKTTNRWTVLLAATGFALAVSATPGLACEDHKKAAATADAKAGEAKPADAKTAKALPATAEVEKGCCAKKGTEAKKTGDAKAVPAVATAGCDKPCDGAEAAGCPKKAAPAAATVAQVKTEPAKDAAPADPGKDH